MSFMRVLPVMRKYIKCCCIAMPRNRTRNKPLEFCTIKCKLSSLWAWTILAGLGVFRFEECVVSALFFVLLFQEGGSLLEGNLFEGVS